MKTLLIAALLVIAIPVMAQDWPQELPLVLEYNHVVVRGMPENRMGDYPWTLMGKDYKAKDGSIKTKFELVWNAPYPPPTIQQATALVESAKAWDAVRQAETGVNADTKALLKLLRDKLGADKVPTDAQLVEAVKAEKEAAK